MGYCSRSQAALLILAKRVRVNGRIARNPETPARIGQDRIEIDGLPVEKRTAIYLVMNKPRGLVTTASDEKGRETIYDLLEPSTPWVGPVGRLDKASEGLLLLTNDSEWAARITDPVSHLDKVYHVHVGIVADAEILKRLIQGVTTENGEVLRAKDAHVVRKGERNSWIEMV